MISILQTVGAWCRCSREVRRAWKDDQHALGYEWADRRFSKQELNNAIATEAAELDAAYERQYPGFKSTPEGMQIDVPIAVETTKGWPA